MTAIAKIHVLKNQAKLDDDTYRDILERETGKRSSKGMSHSEQLKVISALKTIAPKQDGQRATGKFARKLQALWIAGYNLGVIYDKSDGEMIKFLKRQTKLEHHRFLQDNKDAIKAIDALKLWIRRETQNYDLFTQDRNASPLQNDFRFQICLHIWQELVKQGRTPANTLAEFLTGRSGQSEVFKLTSNDWISAMNALGKMMHRKGKL
ncbi:hypothetical protein IWQ54_000200 [Labrenzia sp. EL_195]|nr:hypothetical protein [Labrenzia sp. EL_195]